MLQAAAQEGNTAPPALEDVVDLHFVALVNKNSRLVELDGRKSFPIDHGKTSDRTLLQVRCQHCRCYTFSAALCWQNRPLLQSNYRHIMVCAVTRCC